MLTWLIALAGQGGGTAAVCGRVASEERNVASTYPEELLTHGVR